MFSVGKGENDRRKYFTINVHDERMLSEPEGLKPQPPDNQSDARSTGPPRSALTTMYM